MCAVFFFFQAEDGIRDRSPSRGLGDVYKRQVSRSSGRLTDKNAAYDKQIAALTQQIDEQNKRKEELQTRSIYVTTKQFIEEFAREKLGLVYEDELIFRANDNSGK